MEKNKVGNLAGRDRENYYIQTNNPTEAALKVYGEGSWLVSCGPAAMVNCLAGAGCVIPDVWMGDYRLQPEEVVFDYLNDPRNLPKLMAIRKLDLDELGIGAQEVPQYYPHVASVLFRATAHYRPHISKRELLDALKNRCTVQVSIEPGHYVAVVGYDWYVADGEGVAEDVIYNDPWPRDGIGFNTRSSIDSFYNQMKGYGIIYEPGAPF